MTWTKETPQGNEAAKVKYDIVEFTRGTGLELGCGPWKLYNHFIGIDNGHHFGTNGCDLVQDCSSLPLFASESVDFVFSSHLLEHIQDYKSALKEWFRVIKPGGHLVLYLPHKDFYPNVGHEWANPDHKHDFLPQDIISAMDGGWDLVVNEERSDGIEYSFLQVYKKTGTEKTFSCREEKPKKTCAVVRYGGFGDMIQMSSILPGLKKQGYHITVFTTHKGKEIVEYDQNIDRFVLQDPDQVPNQELTAFWEVHSKKYHKFINLSESVEGTFLALPGRTPHLWPHEARHKLLNVNYLEFTHIIAGVPPVFNQKFYPTEEEKQWAYDTKKSIGGRLILWTLAGSSVHKTWPWLDQAIARIMLTYKDVNIMFVGDEYCQILEQGWENEPRVIRNSGKLSIRHTLALAQVCDVVVGPETGVLNSVGFINIPKILFLSHSSIENLSKHWKNVYNLVPENCKCYPCHTLHYGWANCKEYQESGVSECQASISCDKFTNVLNKVLK